MRATLRCEKPDQISYTVVVTATVREWQALRDLMKEIGNEWKTPLSELRDAISAMSIEADKVFFAAERTP